MGLTKTEAFTTRQNEIAGYFKALAHPARVAILEYLIDKDKCICGDLVDVLPLAQATVSQHLAELKKAGLIRGTISGTSMCYCLDKTEWAKCIRVLESLFGDVKNATDCCT
jgi:DNA-binding transcriptional ArsR family regulator